MNRMQLANAERALTVVGRLRRFGLFKMLGLMLLLACTLGIASVHLIPTLVRLGLSARTADKLPYFGFLVGLLIGCSAPLSRAVMLSLQVGLAVPLLLSAVLGSVLSVIAGLAWAIEMAELLPIVAVVAVVLTAGFVLITLLIDRLAGLLGPRKT